MKEIKFNYIIGEKAYSLLYLDYELNISLSHLYLFWKNLEMIIDDKGITYARRYDEIDRKFNKKVEAKRIEEINYIKDILRTSRFKNKNKIGF